MDKLLTTLAFLKVSFETNEFDYIETLLPLFVSLIIKKNYHVVQTETIIDDFRSEYGILIPYHPVITILNRLRKQGYFFTQNKKYYIVQEKFQTDNFSEKVAFLEIGYKRIINEFIAFSALYKYEMNEETAENTLISFLKNYDLDILFNNLDFESPLPEVQSTLSEKYLIGKFITKTYSTNPELYNLLTDIALGHIILSTAILRDYSNYQGKLSGLNIFIDIGFLFNISGLNGEFRKNTYKEFFRILNQNNINIFIFRHTLNEFLGIVESCAINISKDIYDPNKASPTLQYFIENGKTKSDIYIFKASIPGILEEFNIIVEDTPIPLKEEETFQIGEQKLIEEIVGAYKRFNPSFDYETKESTIQLDVRSISAIYHFRKGKRPLTIKDARYFFLTTNSTLAFAARIFNSKEFQEDFFTIPCVITDLFLGTILWAQSPALVLEYSKKRLIACAYSTVEPNKNLKSKLVKQAKRLQEEGKINEDQVVLLLETQISDDLLAEKTLGDPNKFTERTSLEILEDYKDEIRDQERQKFQQENNAIVEKLNLLEQNKEKINNRQSKQDIDATKIGVVISWILFSLLSLIFGVSLFLALGLVNLQVFWRILFGVIAFFVGLLELVFGFNLKLMKRNLQRIITNWVRKNIYYLE